METAAEQMRNFANQRREIALELASCAAAGAALWAIAGRLDGAPLELKALFVALLVAFGVAAQNLVPQLIPVLAFRCPRCTMPFHAATDRLRARAILGLRACAHCGLRVRACDSHES